VTTAAVDARVTRVERLVVDSEPVSDATRERLRRLLAGSASSRSSTLSVVTSSSVSSSSAVRRPRLRTAVCFGCSVMVEDEIEAEVEVEDVGAAAAAAVFVRLLRCLLVDCFALALVLVLAVGALAVRGGGEGRGSEPAVAVVETLLSEERVEVSLVVEVVDPMEAMVEVLPSADGFGTLLDA